ncbi:MAG TPA: tetratricopeptide repeat protein, partial [Gemmatimonadaceae bacterium]
MANSALIEDLEKQFAENPRRVFARLANEYRKSGHLDSAIEICRKQVPLQPTYISGYIVLGQALFDSAQFDEARTTFETALGLDPENLIALRQLGDIARATGDAEGARAWYHRLLDVDPQNDEIAEQLRELEASAGAPSREAVSWSDINPEQHAATAEGAAPSAPPLELPALELPPPFPDIAAFAPPPAPPAPPARQAPSAPAPLDLDLDALADSPVADAADSPRMPEPAAHARAAGDLDTIDGLEFPSADEIAGSEPSATEQLERAAAAIDLDFAPGASAAPPLPWNDGAAEKDRALEPEALAELDLAFDAPAPGEAPPPPVHAEHRREPELEPV